jgi:hypothetical protein
MILLYYSNPPVGRVMLKQNNGNVSRPKFYFCECKTDGGCMARFKQPQLSRLQIMPIKTYFPTFSKKKTPSDKFFFFYSSHPTVVP